MELYLDEGTGTCDELPDYSIEIRFNTKEEAERYKIRLQNMNRYRWHDLRKNPDDLPESGDFMNRKDYLVAIGIGGDVIYYNVLEYAHGWNCYVMSNGSIYRGSEMHNVLAWREIEPFESGVE